MNGRISKKFFFFTTIRCVSSTTRRWDGGLMGRGFGASEQTPGSRIPHGMAKRKKDMFCETDACFWCTGFPLQVF
ncbi:hypothetical protein BT67DRAFT_23304 [Trichocladium antarcticum]|uniref:Uncharacterized protein n=1 Tax=Trichocladium antarcticum TaxID=1450529 RepID=A0AAN6ZGZ9_9PEZI|nr:hypothetical protein BT67DRAFT_23304 [Trichocladium antarcticum]